MRHYFLYDSGKWTLLVAVFLFANTHVTIGFGNPHPVTSISKTINILYVILGISILLGFIEKFSRGLTACKNEE